MKLVKIEGVFCRPLTRKRIAQLDMLNEYRVEMLRHIVKLQSKLEIGNYNQFIKLRAELLYCKSIAKVSRLSAYGLLSASGKAKIVENIETIDKNVMNGNIITQAVSHESKWRQYAKIKDRIFD